MQRARKLHRDLPDASNGRDVERLGRQHQGGVPAVHAGILDVLGDGPQHQLSPVGHGIDLDFARVGLEFGDDDGVLGRNHRGPCQDAAQLDRFVRDRHRRPAQNVARAHQHGESAQLFHGPIRLGCVNNVRPARLIDLQFVEERAEFRAVLGLVDGFRAGAEDSHARLWPGASRGCSEPGRPC